VRLAFIAALQYLPPRQRAVLILRDVLAWRATEVADLLGTTTAAVNSALQRARAQLAEVAPAEDEVTEPEAPDHRELLGRYVAAFENADVTALIRLLREDATLEMPPALTWFSGRDAIGRFIARILARSGPWRMVPTGANGQPALGVYTGGGDGPFHAHSIHVFTISGSHIARIVAFQDSGLFAAFGLPQTQPAR
jgi:RNA polymerase sigma-70 factor (ECF subfamily)